MSSVQTVFRGCLCLFVIGCLTRSTAGNEHGYVNQWKASPLRPPAFGEFPTKTTQKIIHVGYPKTGTVSLQKVVDLFGLTHLHGNLGYKPEGWSRDSRTSMEEVLGSVDAWLEMLGRFELEKLLALYPEAKYILTTRDPDAWYRSATRFFKGMMTDEYFVKHFGSSNFSDAETWKNSFLAHNEKVKRTIPAENLLVIDLTAGNSTENMQKLCQFVEVSECPAGGIPHEHSTDVVLEKRRSLRSQRSLATAREAKSTELGDELRKPDFAYVTMISSQSKTLKEDVEQVKAWAGSLYQTETNHGVLCAVVGGHLSDEQEQELGSIVSISYPEDSLSTPLELPLGLKESLEARLELSKLFLAKLQVKALMYMSPGTLALKNLDARLEEFAESKRAFEAFVGSDGVSLDHGSFMLAPRRVARTAMAVAQTRSWSPQRGWLSQGPLDLGVGPGPGLGLGQVTTLRNWDFPGSAGGLGIFLSGCAAGSAAAFPAGCSLKAADNSEVLCKINSTTQCQAPSTDALRRLAEAAPRRLNLWYAWHGPDLCYLYYTGAFQATYEASTSQCDAASNPANAAEASTTTTSTSTTSSTATSTTTTTSSTTATTTTTSSTTATATSSTTSSTTATATSSTTTTATTAGPTTTAAPTTTTVEATTTPTATTVTAATTTTGLTAASTSTSAVATVGTSTTDADGDATTTADVGMTTGAGTTTNVAASTTTTTTTATDNATSDVAEETTTTVEDSLETSAAQKHSSPVTAPATALVGAAVAVAVLRSG